MEKKTSKSKMENKESCCGSGMCNSGMMHSHCHSHGGRGFLKLIFGLLFIALIVSAVFHASRWGRYGGMMGYGYGGTGYGYETTGYGMMGNYRGGFGGMMFGRENNEVFGTVTSVQGNTIAIINNAGETETFQSTAETVVFNSTGLVPFSSLKVGDNLLISAKGERERDKDDAVEKTEVMEAKLIRIVEPTTAAVPLKK